MTASNECHLKREDMAMKGSRKKKEGKSANETVKGVHGMLKSRASATKALTAEHAKEEKPEMCGKKATFKVIVKGKAYEVVTHTTDDDCGCWIECPALPGCDSQGEKEEEALEMIKDAIKGHLAVAAKKKKKRAAE